MTEILQTLNLNYLFYNIKNVIFKVLLTALKEAHPAAARKILLIVATKLESTAHCGTVPVPPHYRTAQN